MNDDFFSFFTDDRLAKIASLDHEGATNYLMTELNDETKDIRPKNKEKIIKMVENSRTHTKLLEGSYNFRLSAIGLKTI